MISSALKNFEKRSIESRFFIFFMICAIPYFAIHIAVNYVNDEASLVGVIYLALSLTCASALYLAQKKFQTNILIKVFTCLVLSLAIYYLPHSSGPHGSISYTLQTFTVACILMNKGTMRWIVAAVLAGYTIALTGDFFEFDKVIKYNVLLIDFYLNLILLSLLMIYFKRSYDAERKMNVDETRKLEILKKDLERQTMELEQTMHENLRIKNNLEELVKVRTSKVHQKHQERRSYTFTNAHHVRAPLSDIIGLATLFPDDPHLSNVRTHANELDKVLRKIGKALAD